MLAAIADAGGLDPILERVADGDTIRTISLDLGCTRCALNDWLNEEPERRALYRAARAASAAALADAALDIADASRETGTSKARLQIETRQWLAGVYNREDFGVNKQPGVTVNIGSLHLDSLRQSQGVPEGPIIELTPLESKKLT